MLSRLIHPDKNLKNNDSTIAFQKLTKAYKDLLDDERRKHRINEFLSQTNFIKKNNLFSKQRENYVSMYINKVENNTREKSRNLKIFENRIRKQLNLRIRDYQNNFNLNKESELRENNAIKMVNNERIHHIDETIRYLQKKIKKRRTGI